MISQAAASGLLCHAAFGLVLGLNAALIKGIEVQYKGRLIPAQMLKRYKRNRPDDLPFPYLKPRKRWSEKEGEETAEKLKLAQAGAY